MNESNETRCAVARDLMPLIVDRVASEESRAWVDRHVASCAACAQALREMSARVPDAAPLSAQEITVRQAMRRIARGFTRRRIAWIMAGLLIALCAAAFAPAIYHRLFDDYSTDMPLSWVSASLSLTADGRALITLDMQKEDRHWYALNAAFFSEQQVLLLTPIKPRIARSGAEYADPTVERTDCVFADGAMYYREVTHNGSRYDSSIGAQVDDWRTEDHPIREIRFGTEDEFVVLYAEGDALPYCGDALNKRYTEGG